MSRHNKAIGPSGLLAACRSEEWRWNCEPGQVWAVDIGCARSNLQCIGQRAKNNSHVARINNGMSGRASIHCLDVIRMRVGVLFLSWRLLLLRSSFSMRHAASLIYPVPRGNRTRHMDGHTDFREIADHTRTTRACLIVSAYLGRLFRPVGAYCA